MSWTTTKERGSVLGMRVIVACLRLFGRRVARFASEFAIAYYFLSARRARAASRQYLERVAALPQGRAALGRAPDAWMTWMHFRAFGHSLVDRAAIWSGLGARFTVEFPNRAELLALQSQSRGAILLGAHLGSIDVLRALVTKKTTRVRMLMFQANARKINAVFKSIDPDLESRTILLDQGSIEPMLALSKSIASGDFVAVLGDRPELSSSKRIGRARFLGREAAFPLGPLWIAALLECPVYLIFALRRSNDVYDVHLEPFAEKIVLDRKHRDRDLQRWLERYVERLEARCLEAPLQWFNFYDVWNAGAVEPASANEMSESKGARDGHAVRA